MSLLDNKGSSKKPSLLESRMNMIKNNIDKAQNEAKEVANENIPSTIETHEQQEQMSSPQKKFLNSNASGRKSFISSRPEEMEEIKNDFTPRFDLKKIIKKDKAESAGKMYYLDKRIINTVKYMAEKQDISESKVVNDILKYVFNID